MNIPGGGPVESVPAELRALPQWVGWKRVERDGKATKVLVNPANIADVVSAYTTAPDDGRLWQVVWANEHKTLRAGDIGAVAGESRGGNNCFVRRSDLTIHSLEGESGYLLLIPAVPPSAILPGAGP